MFRKITFAVLIFVMGINIFAFAYAGDIITSEQDFVVLASVLDITENKVVIEPFHIISNTEKQSLPNSIKLDKFKYSYCTLHSQNEFNMPKIGDNIVVSLSYNDGIYRVKNGTFKTDTVDYKTLTVLAPESMKNQPCILDVAALAYFIRTDGKYTDFIYTSESVSVSDANKKFVLYPSDVSRQYISYVSSQGQIITNKSAKDVIDEIGMLPQDDNYIKRNIALVMIIFSVVAGAAIIIIIQKRMV